MTKIITIPLHIGDWLGGTLGWDATECGAYINLIVAHYNYGLNGLPSDSSELAKLAKCSKKIWARIEDKILQKFTQNGSKITHSRIILEIQKITKKSSENSANSLKRWKSVNAVASVSQSDGNANHKPETINHKPLTNITPYNPPKSKSDYSESFLEFWKAYPPNHGSKAAAFKSFKNSTKDDRDGKITKLIIEVAGKYAEHCSRTGAFIAHASTWLNQRRWEVDYELQATGSYANKRPSTFDDVLNVAARLASK